MSYVNVTANQADQNYAANSEYDLDCDGSIGWGDDAILTDNWLLPGPQGDFTGDDIINFLDFVEFAIVWEDR